MPKTRTRTIATLQAYLSYPVFSRDKGMGILEQLLGLERLKSTTPFQVKGLPICSNVRSAESHATTPEAAYPVDNG